MRKNALVLTVLVFMLLMLTGCESLFGPAINQVAYAMLEGMWVVESRPEGWVGSRWDFGTDHSWTAYWQHDAHYLDELVGVIGAIIRCAEEDIRTRIETSLLADQNPGDVVTMTYAINAEK